MSGKDYAKRSLSHDDYKTDEWILRMFPNFFDPCPLFGVEEMDGLNVSWDYYDYDGVFVNPPYSKPKPWVQKAIRSRRDAEHGSAYCIVMLLKHDTSTEWYRLLHEFGAHFLLVNGRLKHGTNTGAAFPSMLVIL